MERAAGEGVQIHHVNERGGAVDERSVVRREGEQIAEAVGIAHVEAAGRAVYGVLGIPSGGRELFFIAVCIPDRVEDRQRVVDSRGGLVLCRGLGRGRAARGKRKDHCKREQQGKELSFLHSIFLPK